jgi:hypothetical protein
MMTEQRFPIRLDSWWQPLLLAGGATPESSFVELREDDIRVRFGFFFDQTLLLSDIESVQETAWPWFFGVGWRTNFLGQVALIGSHRGVVELKLRASRRAWGLVRYRRLVISLEEPQRFVEAIAKAALQAAANGAARATTIAAN